MRRVLLPLLPLVLAACAPATVLEGARLIDGTGAAAVEDAALVVQGGRVSYAGPRAGAPAPFNARRIDVRGKTLMPGLFDVHVHPGLIDGMAISAENYSRARIERDANHQLFFGVTHFLSLGFDRDAIFELREAQRAGRAGGARAYTAGHGFAPVSGWKTPVPHGAARDSDWYNRPAGAEEARALVRKEAARRSDIIKVWVDDLRGTFVKMPPELYGVIIDEAHRQKLKVAAHIVFLEDARELVRRGVDVLAHSVRDREIDDELLRLAATKGVVYVPTLIQARFFLDYAAGAPAYLADPELNRLYSADYLRTLGAANHKRFSILPGLEQVRRQYETAMTNARRVAAAGIPIATGGDTGVPGRFHGLSAHLEMEALVQAGLNPAQAIRAATLNGARLLGVERSHGSLEAGKVADFVVVDGNPLVDISQSRRIEAVWMNGAAVDRAALSRP